jgi:hypothetical protein
MRHQMVIVLASLFVAAQAARGDEGMQPKNHSTAKHTAKGTSFHGKFESFQNGLLTLVGHGRHEQSQGVKQFQLDESVRVTVYSGDQRVDSAGTAAFTETKPGTTVTLRIDATGKVIGARIGTASKKK